MYRYNYLLVNERSFYLADENLDSDHLWNTRVINVLLSLFYS